MLCGPHTCRHNQLEQEREGLKDSGSTPVPTLDQYLKPKMVKFAANNHQQKAITSSISSNLIVGCGLPVSLVEHASFRSFMELVEPRFTCPTRSADRLNGILFWFANISVVPGYDNCRVALSHINVQCVSDYFTDGQLMRPWM